MNSHFYLRFRRGLVGTALALIAAGMLLGGCAPVADLHDGALINVDGRRLFLRCRGEGSPVIVIDTGLGGRLEDWSELQIQLSAETEVCIYARAGYPPSDPGPLPRDAAAAAAELRALLKKARLPAPYLLVGHALGGVNAQVFAGLYPDLVAGLVLLDAPPCGWLLGDDYPELRAILEGDNARWAEAARQARTVTGAAQAAFVATVYAEQNALLGPSAEQLRQVTSFGDLPLVVVAGALPDADYGAQATEFQTYWIAQNRRLAGLSTRGSFVLAKCSGQNLPISAPETVAEAVGSVLAAVR